MEGRGFSGFYRDTSEEIFLKSLMENSVGMPMPTMEMPGFKDLSHNLRTDSEELFKSWLTNAENHGYNSPSMGNCRQSRRISTELGNISNLQNGDTHEKKRSSDTLPAESSFTAEDVSGNLKNAAEKEWQARNLYLAWFHSSQPMTRSRSSELRRRYVAMQNAQTSIGMEAMLSPTGPNDKMKQEFSSPSGFSMNQSISEIPDQLGTFISPSNSSSSTFNAQGVDNLDQISSVVSMLKGTLERKKLASQINIGSFADASQGLYATQDIPANNIGFDQGLGSQIHDMSAVFQEASTDQVKDHDVVQAVEGTIDLDLEHFMNGANPIQLAMMSHEPSQSESSAVAPVISSGFEACDGPSYSSQTLAVCESSRKNAGSSGASQNGSRTKDFRERIIDNLKEDPKRSLARYNSVTSVGSANKGDSTKKRRVERSRKMAEAKERNSTSTIPSDMQAVLKRCENLEKEVRSLKLNLSFMNRKDSEQTKQIEELQKQNEELTEEKERLLEEIERILTEGGNK